MLRSSGCRSAMSTPFCPAEQEMVAAERVFQYVELGSSGTGVTRQPALLQPPPPPPPRPAQQCGGTSKRRAEAQSSPGQGSLRQPLLPPPQPPPAWAGSKSGSGWLQAGHVRFEDVWLRYEPWQQGGASRGALPSSCAPATGPGSLGTAGAGGSSSGSGGNSSSSGSGGSPWVLRGVTLDILPGEWGLRHLTFPHVPASLLFVHQPSFPPSCVPSPAWGSVDAMLF